MEMAQPSPLPPKQPPLELEIPLPKIKTWRTPLIVGGLVFIVAIVTVVFILTAGSKRNTFRQQQTPPQPAQPAMSSKTVNRYPSDYGKVMTQPAVIPKAETAAPAAKAELPPQATPLNTPQPTTTPTPAATAQPAASPPTTPPQQRRQSQSTPPPAQAQKVPQQPQEKKVNTWLADAWSKGVVGKSPFGDEPKEDVKPKANPLLKTANWVRPYDVTRVLYRTQFIPGLTLGTISSDISQSDVRIMVTRHVYDRWGKNVLIPQNSLLIGTTQGGAPKTGETRLAFQMEQLHFPDGVILDLGKAKLNDAAGQAGLTGNVNNHYGQIGLAAVLTAALSIGARGAAGSASGFQENLPQQYAGNVAQSISQSGSQIVNRQLLIPPTITIPEATAVTITLQDNVNLAEAPEILQ